jgi:hypothetical protein
MTTKSNKTVKREDLGLPPLSKPTDLSKFQAGVMKIAMEKV